LPDEVATIKKYYLAHGGKEERWLEWATGGSAAESVRMEWPRPEFNKTLADFEARDLAGRTWTLADLKGKATFVGLWATWCGSCRGEHEELQALYEKIKDREDLQLFTISIDENPYLAETYMKENGYTFPVIVSQNLGWRLFPALGLPSAYLVDPQGQRSSRFHFRGVDGTLKELEKVAGAR